jgi:hypothetical protein
VMRLAPRRVSPQALSRPVLCAWTLHA